MDGTERLSLALYGKEIVGKWIGGSNAPMLHDAVDKIEALQKEIDSLRGVACNEEQASGNGPCGACINCLRTDRDNYMQAMGNLARTAREGAEGAVCYKTALEEIRDMAGSHTVPVPDPHPAGYGRIYDIAQKALKR